MPSRSHMFHNSERQLCFTSLELDRSPNVCRNPLLPFLLNTYSISVVDCEAKTIGSVSYDA